MSKKVLGIIFSNAHDETLSEMTDLRTMGSVPFGGRFRLIDFPLSNMVNAGITKIGVITKSNYQSLMDHIGSGRPWDLSRKTDGLFILPPFNLGGAGYYHSRSEALDGAMKFISSSNERYVILSDSNLVANIDFDELIKQHEDTGADITMVCAKGRAPKNIPNILNLQINDNKEVVSAALDNAQGKEGSYCLNIYMMEKHLLQRLIADSMAHSEPHFQKDVILGQIGKLKIFSYEFTGYSCMIDGLSSYFGANMDLLNTPNRQDLFRSERTIFTKAKDSMPTRYGLASNVKNTLVADGCVIDGEVENCILFRNVTVGKGAKLKNCIVMQNAYVSDDAQLEYTILDKEVVIKPGKRLSGADTYPVYVGKKIII